MTLHDSSLKNTLEVINKFDGITVVEKGLTFEKCTDCAKISTQKRLNGKLNLQIALVKLLINLQENINSSRPLTAEQMKTVASDIIETYPTESIEDFALCFKMARRGDFVNSFGTIDSIVINIWFKEYLELKAINRENKAHIREIGERKSGLPKSEALQKLVDAVRIDKPRKNVKRITFEEDYERIKGVIEDYHPRYDEAKLMRLKRDMINNDSSSGNNYTGLIELINNKLNVKNTSDEKE